MLCQNSVDHNFSKINVQYSHDAYGSKYTIAEKEPSFLCRWFKNPCYNEFTQLVSAFCLGVILSPWSYGIKWFLAFIIVYEFVFGFIVNFQMPYWRPLARIGIICASILGWILGRIAVERPFR